MKILSAVRALFTSKKRIAFTLLILTLIGFVGVSKYRQANQAPEYQTAQAIKGTLVESVTSSGNITSGSSVSITTQASGVVKDVLVQVGESVTAGQEIGELTLDQASQQKQSSALASLLKAQSDLASSKNDLNTLQNTEFTANQKLINDAVARGLSTTDPVYIEEQASWLAAEADYKNQQMVINQASQSLTSAELAYQETSPIITAPISGVIDSLSIAPGSALAAASSTTANANSAIGSIKQPGPIQAQVNVSEIDSVNVNPGQQATLTLDAFPGKTFTGSVVSINTSGVVSSGVTSYPATISIDTAVAHIYPNMAANAKIITKVKNDVLMVPSQAVQTQNGQSTVRVLKNNQVQIVPVEIGDSNDTQTEITSGLSEGDTVVTSVINQSSSQSQSPFGLRSGGFGGGGGGAVFRGRGG